MANETFIQFMRRCGKDQRESGRDCTAADYFAAAGRLERLIATCKSIAKKKSTDKATAAELRIACDAANEWSDHLECTYCGAVDFHKDSCARPPEHCTECDGNGYHTGDCPNATGPQALALLKELWAERANGQLIMTGRSRRGSKLIVRVREFLASIAPRS